jgi:hypothetical protein
MIRLGGPLGRSREERPRQLGGASTGVGRSVSDPAGLAAQSWEERSARVCAAIRERNDPEGLSGESWEERSTHDGPTAERAL